MFIVVSLTTFQLKSMDVFVSLLIIYDAIIKIDPELQGQAEISLLFVIFNYFLYTEVRQYNIPYFLLV